MLTFEDVFADENLYAEWLMSTCTADELADHVAMILSDVGLGVTESFAGGLCRLDAADLAGFRASNWAFATDDRDWLDHCASAYPPSPNACETPAERNGLRSTWGIGR